MVASGTNSYYLFYGAGAWDRPGAGVGYATCSPPSTSSRGLRWTCQDQSVAAPWLATRVSGGTTVFSASSGPTRVRRHRGHDHGRQRLKPGERPHATGNKWSHQAGGDTPRRRHSCCQFPADGAWNWPGLPPLSRRTVPGALGGNGAPRHLPPLASNTPPFATPFPAALDLTRPVPATSLRTPTHCTQPGPAPGLPGRGEVPGARARASYIAADAPPFQQVRRFVAFGPGPARRD